MDNSDAQKKPRATILGARMSARSAPYQQPPQMPREPGVQAPYTTAKLRDVELTNKDYFDAIDTVLRGLEQPTVADEMHAMCQKGNAPYFDNWRGYFHYITAREETFEPNRLTHEILHPCTRAPHSVQGEVHGLPFETGFFYGVHLWCSFAAIGSGRG